MISSNISNKVIFETWLNTIKNHHSAYLYNALNHRKFYRERIRIIDTFRRDKNYFLASQLELESDSRINSAMNAIKINENSEFDTFLKKFDKWNDKDLSELVTLTSQNNSLLFLKKIYQQKNARNKCKAATNKILLEYAEKGNIEGVKLLVNNGQADTYQGNDSGFSALALAAKNGDITMAEFLIEKGALIATSTLSEKWFSSHPRTQCPIKLARDHGYNDLADWLHSLITD